MGSLFLFRRDDSGMALFIAMAAIALMFLLTTTAFYFASQTLFEAKLADQHDVAFQAASSGVMVAFADLQAKLSSLPIDGPHTYPYAGTIATSTASYAATATYDVASSSYDCTSTGTSADGTKELVVASFLIIPAGPALLPYGSEVYANTFNVDPNGNGEIDGALYVLLPTATVFPTISLGGAMTLNGGPIYIRNGNLDIKNGSPLTVYTNGTVTVSKNQAAVTVKSLNDTGTVTMEPVDATAFLSQSLANAVTQSTDNLLGDSGMQSYVPEPAQYAYSRYGGATTGPYKVVNNSLTLPPQNDFGYVSGTSHDDFAYRGGKLYLEGTVYVNGDVSITSDITYVGRGTIVCTGKMTINADVRPDTSDKLTPDSRHLLCGFSSGDLTFNNNQTCVGAFYTKGAVLVSNKATVIGSIVSESGLGTAKNNANSLTLKCVPGIGGFVSPGMPDQVTTSSGTTGSPSLKMTFWKRL